MMKFATLLISLFLCVFLFAAEEKIAEKKYLPDDFEKKLESSSMNWMEKKVNEAIGRAVTSKKAVIDEICEYIFIQVIPNFAYATGKGEEQLGDDLMLMLGKIKTSNDAVIQELSWSQLQQMGLPFKKKLSNSLLVAPEHMKNDIDVTFFVEMNALTNKVFNTFQQNKEYQAIYNSEQRFYRIKAGDLKLFYMIFVPNLSYEIVFTGEPFENVIKNYLDELKLLFSVMKKFEKKIIADKALDYDGRYIKGKDIFVDMWFFNSFIKDKGLNADNIMQDILAKKPIHIGGNEKGAAK